MFLEGEGRPFYLAAPGMGVLEAWLSAESPAMAGGQSSSAVCV